MRMRHFWTQNGSFAPNKIFFRKLLKSFSSTYYSLSLCKIFKKILPADPELWGCAIFGPKMAHFEVESPKTMFLGRFWQFLVNFARWGFFPKNPALAHTTIYGPLTPCYVSEKTNEPTPRKLTHSRKDVRKDGWTDGQTLFYRTLPAEAGGPIKECAFFYLMFLNIYYWEKLTFSKLVEKVNLSERKFEEMH